MTDHDKEIKNLKARQDRALNKLCKKQSSDSEFINGYFGEGERLIENGEITKGLKLMNIAFNEAQRKITELHGKEYMDLALEQGSDMRYMEKLKELDI